MDKTTHHDPAGTDAFTPSVKTTKQNSIRNLAVAIITASTFFLNANSASALDDAWKIAMKFDIKGKGGFNTCLPFAKDLYNRMTTAGGESHLIIYEWKSRHEGKGRHAVVVYRDSRGDYFAMDNRSRKPKWIGGKDPSSWVQSYEWGKTVQVLSHQTVRGLAGKSAKLNRSTYVASK
ncbi:MAG: hypothetical protein AAGA18_11985 [Verrucomicrobiota bacterium]